MYRIAIVLLAWPVFGGDRVEVATTERFDFAPGGTIRVTHSYGDLHVDGWARQEVESL
jgi:hypothetical protein